MVGAVIHHEGHDKVDRLSNPACVGLLQVSGDTDLWGFWEEWKPSHVHDAVMSVVNLLNQYLQLEVHFFS